MTKNKITTQEKPIRNNLENDYMDKPNGATERKLDYVRINREFQGSVRRGEGGEIHGWWGNMGGQRQREVIKPEIASDIMGKYRKKIYTIN